MKPMLTLVCLALMLATPTLAQENLTADTEFFKQKSQDYQRWMDQNGLGRYLKVQDLRVEPELVRLYLGFHSHNIDSIVGIWHQMKAAHESSPGLTFEESLLSRMASLMGLGEDEAVIEIYDTYDMVKEPLFFRGIYFDKNRIQVEENNPKGEKNRYISVNPSDIKTNKKSEKIALTKKYTKEYVFEQIMQFARQKYSKSPCDERKPAIHPKLHEDHLRFEVSDLCREVVKDAENPTICRWLRTLGLSDDCNWTTRELLSFNFVYLPTTDGFTLHLVLDGRVGSGYYKTIKRSGYMDMDLDFKEELEEYADQISLEIKKFLTR